MLLFHGCGGPAPEPAPEPQAPAPEPRFADPELPGLSEKDPALIARLEAASASLERAASGAQGERSLNRLLLEPSAYIRAHGNQPINWYPWGEEALARARAENKPIFLSIGYSTCHWCHVMARESFEDVAVAEELNRHFVAIKVDREQRPDVSEVYQQAVELLTGSGGWPMTLLLTPRGKAFFGALYVPPDAQSRRGEGLLHLLRTMRERYQNNPHELEAIGRDLSRRLSAQTRWSRPRDTPDVDSLIRGARAIAEPFDREHGGFGLGAKFPPAVELDFLLRYLRRTGDPWTRRILEQSLRAMREGSLCDPVGGGFHRYAVDRAWRRPHFEKMLATNALLARLFIDAYQLLGDPADAREARRILAFLEQEMSTPEGGFVAALDAESPDASGRPVEGLYYTWTLEELREALGEEAASLVAEAYLPAEAGGGAESESESESESEAESEAGGEAGAEGGGGGERYALALRRPIAALAASRGMSEARLRRALEAGLDRLRGAREARPRPLRDGAVITAWHALAISAFAHAGRVLGDEALLERARRGAELLLGPLLREPGRLRRAHRPDADPPGGGPAFLEDYAYAIAALLDVFEALGEARYLEEAIALQATLDEDFLDDRDGGYFLAGPEHEELLVQSKPIWDRALPSANAVTIQNLLRLSALLRDDSLRARAEEGLETFANQIRWEGARMPSMLSALERYLDTELEVILAIPGAEGERGGAAPLRAALRRAYLPNALRIEVREGEPLPGPLLELLEGKLPVQARATAYVCERGRCDRPTSDASLFARQLARARPLREGEDPAAYAIPPPPGVRPE